MKELRNYAILMAGKAAKAEKSEDALRFSQAATNTANALSALNNVKDMASSDLSEDRIKDMVSRFLAWRLPDGFRPDGGISFKPEFNEHTAHPMRHEPTGTNLFDCVQAEAMVRYMIAT